MRDCGLDSPDLRCGPVAGSCEDGNEPAGSLIGGGVLTSSVTIYFSRSTLIYDVNYIIIT
jgi:hypothetical protein